MAIRVYKRTSPGRRNASVNLYSEVTKTRPEKTLLSAKPKKGGRTRKTGKPSAKRIIRRRVSKRYGQIKVR